MNHQNQTSESTAPPTTPVGYEAPQIETVLTPEELEREVFFAGAVGPSTPIQPT